MSQLMPVQPERQRQVKLLMPGSSLHIARSGHVLFLQSDFSSWQFIPLYPIKRQIQIRLNVKNFNVDFSRSIQLNYSMKHNNFKKLQPSLSFSPIHRLKNVQLPSGINQSKLIKSYIRIYFYLHCFVEKNLSFDFLMINRRSLLSKYSFIPTNSISTQPKPSITSPLGFALILFKEKTKELNK